MAHWAGTVSTSLTGTASPPGELGVGSVHPPTSDQTGPRVELPARFWNRQNKSGCIPYKLGRCFIREASSDGLFGTWAMPRGFRDSNQRWAPAPVSEYQLRRESHHLSLLTGSAKSLLCSTPQLHWGGRVCHGRSGFAIPLQSQRDRRAG